MPKIVFIAALLALAPAVSAQTKIEIITRLVGYDLRQAGEPSAVTPLPRITVRSGKEGLIEITREYRYPKEFNDKGKPTVMRTAYLGVRFPIYVRENNGVVTYLARVELCEREDPANPLSPVLKTTTSFSGRLPFDKIYSVEVGAPGGRTAQLELLLTRQ